MDASKLCSQAVRYGVACLGPGHEMVARWRNKLAWVLSSQARPGGDEIILFVLFALFL